MTLFCLNSAQQVMLLVEKAPLKRFFYRYFKLAIALVLMIP